MSRIVAVAAENVRVAVSRERVSRLAERVLRAEGVRDAMLSVTFLPDRALAALNWRHLRHRGPTDVIAFAFAPATRGGPVIGDVYIAPDVARRNAVALRRGVREETLRLVVHGVLHVLGYDHPADESRYRSPMWRRQERLLRSALAAA